MTKNEAAIAFAQGNRVQVAQGSGWVEVSQWVTFDGPWTVFRLKPEPVPPGDLTYEQAVGCIDRHEPLQHYRGNEWFDSESNSDWSTYKLDRRGAYRRKPALKRVPLGPEDVKPGSLVRLPGAASTWCAVLEVDRWSITAFTRAATVLDYLKLQSAYEISRDGGKTWHGCWKEEA